MMSTTTIRVYEGTWKRVNALKEPGESFDDVLNKLVDEYES